MKSGISLHFRDQRLGTCPSLRDQRLGTCPSLTDHNKHVALFVLWLNNSNTRWEHKLQNPPVVPPADPGFKGAGGSGRGGTGRGGDRSRPITVTWSRDLLRPQPVMGQRRLTTDRAAIGRRAPGEADERRSRSLQATSSSSYVKYVNKCQEESGGVRGVRGVRRSQEESEESGGTEESRRSVLLEPPTQTSDTQRKSIQLSSNHD
ncbi:unnamed protein product [Pleuronectes platessa]|uniref:Uncharacterized protein n=1 Tax=Pleuronectes platessa TaxID=8262 RepID=A0A9N7Y1E9_PLEPL|nr:unnamed protein product [Pleuronectes platessa]